MIWETFVSVTLSCSPEAFSEFSHLPQNILGCFSSSNTLFRGGLFIYIQRHISCSLSSFIHLNMGKVLQKLSVDVYDGGDKLAS